MVVYGPDRRKSGRISEQALIDELERGRKALLSEESGRSLLAVIRRRLQTDSMNLYVLDWITEQMEDIVHVLVDGELVACVELPRGGEEELAFEVVSIQEYRRRPGSSRSRRRKLVQAVELASQEQAGGDVVSQ